MGNAATAVIDAPADHLVTPLPAVTLTHPGRESAMSIPIGALFGALLYLGVLSTIEGMNGASSALIFEDTGSTLIGEVVWRSFRALV